MAGEVAMFSLSHTIPSVTRAEVGQYACHVITSFDSAYSTYARLSVRSGQYNYLLEKRLIFKYLKESWVPAAA